MNCGDGVPLCGVLTLESGFGYKEYHHSRPVVHGLWPQVGRYGSSRCLRPQVSASPERVHSCYNERSETKGQLLSFEGHEWKTHGRCAGAIDEKDFFHQVCTLASRPIEIMSYIRLAGGNFTAIVVALKHAGFPVWAVDEHWDQIELSACADNDGRWVLSRATAFERVCGGGWMGPAPGDDADQSRCLLGRRGRPCNQDFDCTHLQGCVRCAHSGYCTAEPLRGEPVHPHGGPGITLPTHFFLFVCILMLVACGLLAVWLRRCCFRSRNGLPESYSRF